METADDLLLASKSVVPLWGYPMENIRIVAAAKECATCLGYHVQQRGRSWHVVGGNITSLTPHRTQGKAWMAACAAALLDEINDP